jgi:hypothetical protein
MSVTVITKTHIDLKSIYRGLSVPALTTVITSLQNFN